MKKLITASIIILLIAGAFASHKAIAYSATERVVFSGISTASTASSSAIAVDGYNVKQVVMVQKYYNANTFSSYSGTITVQCAQTNAGTWLTCADQNGTLLSGVTPTKQYTINDGSKFVRITLGSKKGQRYPYAIIRYFAN